MAYLKDQWDKEKKEEKELWEREKKVEWELRERERLDLENKKEERH